MDKIIFTFYRILENFFRSTTKSNEIYTSLEGSEEELDETGRLTSQSTRFDTYVDEDQAVYVKFPNSLAHSFWRSQEVTIFKRAAKYYKYPLLDFGCGDGSLSASIFDQIDYGVDIDLKALKVANGFNLYKKLHSFEEMVDSIDNNLIATVISVSVLEHTTNLKKCIEEIYRVLKAGGSFYITVPNKNFTKHMTELIDKEFAIHQNKIMYHRNLLSESEWRELLISTGFKIEHFSEFQPIQITRKYFNLSLLGSKSIGRIKFIRNFLDKILLRRNLKNVKNSLDYNGFEGANFYIIAKK